MIYVSHRLSEIFGVCDSYTVFRDGSFVEMGSLADIDKDHLIQLVVGRPLTEEFVKENTRRRAACCRSRGLPPIAAFGTSASICTRARSWRCTA